ncbi:MAG: class I SAM-dependent methyltransferase [Leptospiraceae bacterium]|nr:class I SAM-dependent methyltransferase [Leptospiraceae bacterium]
MKIRNQYFLNSKTKVSFRKKHPWVFNRQIERKKKYSNGAFIRILEKETEKIEGIGIFSSEGLIAIRIIYFGENFTLKEIHRMVEESINKRKSLLQITDSLRWIHGENDGFPGITIDMHGETLIVMAYSDSLLVYARYVSRVLFFILGRERSLNPKPKNIVLRIPRRIGLGQGAKVRENLRTLRGSCPEYILIRYRNITYRINPISQKGGTFDDLRNLRNYILDHRSIFNGKRVLNLFSNNGLTSIVFEKAGAAEIYSLDDSEKSIQAHLDNAVNFDAKRHRIFKLDIFKKLQDFLDKTNLFFDVIVIDPPSLTSSSKDVGKAKTIYARLIEITALFLAEKGTMILCSCSNRIHKNEFERICKEILEKSGKKFQRPVRLNHEIDHPTVSSFPEGDYLKVHIYVMA